MNPGKLNKRLYFYSKSIIGDQEQLNPLFTVWGAKKVKTKRRDSEQNEEAYEFLIRTRNNVEPYLIFQCDDIWYDVLTAEPYEKEKGYLLLKCEKAKIHSFYDSVTVARIEWIETEWGESKEKRNIVYSSIPCQLVKIDSTNVNQTQQQLDVEIKYVLWMETKYTLKPGDELEIIHKQDTYKANVEDYFRNHTFQEVTIKLEGDA